MWKIRSNITDKINLLKTYFNCQLFSISLGILMDFLFSKTNFSKHIPFGSYCITTLSNKTLNYRASQSARQTLFSLGTTSAAQTNRGKLTLGVSTISHLDYGYNYNQLAINHLDYIHYHYIHYHFGSVHIDNINSSQSLSEEKIYLSRSY